jgi:hypothetical protein
MSILKSKHSGWTHNLERHFHKGGGGGGPTQTTGTTYQTNVPEYAQPYVETMLGATQKQLFDMQGNEITGFKPYKPYSTNVNDYVAGFSPLQQQAIQATGQLGVPSEYGQATQMTGMAGLGSLGLAGQMANAGQDFAQQAQNPMAMQGYMSPYMQNVVDYQKSQALRDYQIGQPMRKAQAVGQGAFGGSRQAIMEAEAQRSLGNQLQGIAATGSQKAFEDAQRQQQFGAQLGMQGRQAAMQGLGQYGQMGAQLGDLGGKQLAAQQGIIQSQYGMGQQQQAMEQQKINQAMQDWANTQQYPLMQLGVMSNMLRGLPMQASTTNQYQAAPNALTQGIGAAGAGASLYNALRGASGGLPKEFKPSKTGIKSYYEGEVVESTKADLYDLPLDELQKRAKSSPSPTIKRLAAAIIKEKTNLAGGGIIAFANPNEENNQSLVKEVPEVDKGKKLLGDYLDTNPRTPPNVPPREPILPSSYSESKKDFPLVKEPGQDVRNLRDSFTNLKMPSLSSYEKGIKAAKQPKPEEATPELVELSAPYPVSDMRTKDQIIADANKQNAGVQADPNLSKEDKARLQKRHDEGIAIVKADPNIGVKPPAVASAPAGIKTVAPAVAPTDAKIPGNLLPAEFGLERPAEDPRAKMSISDIAKEKLAFLGPDVRKEERAGLMAERANAKAEARRALSLRMAEFFASWGSTPGSTIAAGLRALQEKVPSIVTDSRKEAEIRRAINKDIAGLDKADRLEKAGAWDEAAKLKSDLGKAGRENYGNDLTFLSARLTDKSRASSAIEVAKIGQTNKENVASTKDLRFYEEEISKLEKNRTEITSGKQSPYVIDQNFIDRNKDKAAKGELSERQKSAYDAAVARKKVEDDKYNNRRAELIAERDRLKGTPAPAPTKTELPPGAIPGSKQIGTSNGVPVYEAPDGKRYTLK